MTTPAPTVAVRPATPQRAAIRAAGLTKIYKDGSGVHGLDLEIPAGVIFGFVGPSGSGKTTTVRLLSGLTRPTSGSAQVLGVEPVSFTTRVRARLGYMPQISALYPELSVRHNLSFAASIAGLSWWRRRARLQRALEFVELDGDERKLVSKISGGMARRLSLAAALVHDPEVLFLDEPTTGIDPMLRRKFWDRFAELRNDERTLFVTTQYVAEAAFCDLVGMIVEGEIIIIDTPEGLRHAAYGGDVVWVEFASPPQPELLAGLERFGVEGTRSVRLDERRTELVVADAGKVVPELAAWCRDQGVDLVSAEEHQPALDEVFVVLVERTRAHQDQTVAE